jgi:hypothetical protein
MILRRLLLGCVLGLTAVAWMPAAAQGGQEAVDCPGGTQKDCVCWRENGALGMACPQSDAATEKGRPRHENRPARVADGERGPAGDPAGAEDDDVLGAATDDERRAALLRRQERINERLLEVQRARFLARMRPERDAAEVKRLEQAFDGVQEQRRSNLRQLQAFETRP